MTDRVQPTDRAEADIERIFAWLSARAPEGARRWYESFGAAAARLRSAPLACGIAPESGAFGEEVRHVLFGTRKGRTYRALFVIRDDIVHILCVRGPGERPARPDDIQG